MSALAQDADASGQPTDEESEDEAQTNGADPDGYVTPTDKQTALNTSAVEAIKNEEYEQAVKLLRRSLELGEMNITYLNLGRAHQRLKECGSAEDAYLAAVSAPPVRSPSPFLIEKKVEQYMEELEAECDEEEWARTSTGSAGSGEYSWEAEPSATSPMMRIGVGIGYAAYGAAPGEGQLRIGPGNLAVETLDYEGAAVHIDVMGGYFLNEHVAIHAGLVANIIPTPTNTIGFFEEGQDDVTRYADDGVNRAGFTGINIGASGYVPGNLFLSGTVGLGLGGYDDEEFDFAIGSGWALNFMLGKDFKLTDQFALGLGAYLDLTSQPTGSGFQMYGAAAGIQTHGTIRFR